MVLGNKRPQPHVFQWSTILSTRNVTSNLSEVTPWFSFQTATLKFVFNFFDNCKLKVFEFYGFPLPFPDLDGAPARVVCRVG